MDTPDRDSEAYRAFQNAGGQSAGNDAVQAADALETDAPFLWRLVMRDPALLDEALGDPLWRADRAETLFEIFEPARRADDPATLRRHLRRGRHRALLRIALRELLSLADIDDTSAEIAQLASTVVDVALTSCRRQAEDRFGQVVDADGSPMALVALGMGKLGGGELNLGSDIDLSFFYSDDEGRSDRGHSAYEVVSEIVTQTTRSIADVTEDGFAFRVDLRLRPEGSRGPVASSLDRALRYYESWGRPWERAVLLRAQPVAGNRELGFTLLRFLRPFIYRRSVDPSIAAEMRRMLEASRRESRSDPDHDLKIGRGGIREAEFFVQSLQLIWGGRSPELQVSSTVEAIRRLAGLGHVSTRDAEALEADWALLRRVEHRLHLQAGYQTHALPENAEGRFALARSLGFDDAAELDREIDAARNRVANLFDSLETEPPPAGTAFTTLADSVAAGHSDQTLHDQVAKTLNTYDHEAAVAHLRRLGARAGSPLGPATRDRFPTLGPQLLSEIADTVDPDAALRFLADFFARLGGGWGFERMLVSHPRRTRRLVGLLGASSTLATSLVAHPDWMAALVSDSSTIDEDSIRTAHDRIDARNPEEATRQLRQLKAETTLRVGLAWVGEEADMAAVQGYLTALAEAQVQCALRLAATTLNESDSHEADTADSMVVLGLGKLGGREMGFGSDLDVVFIYDGTASQPPSEVSAAERFTRIAQRTVRLLSQPDAEGAGYEIDTRLRPSGSQGMLVVSTDAFARYHETRAASWERLALVKARPITGTAARRAHVSGLLEQATSFDREVDARDIARLRERIERELAGEGPHLYHAKIGFGALLDVEFVVQFHQLEQRDTSLRLQNTGDALHALSLEGVFSSSEYEILTSAHRFFRQVEQAVRFLDERTEARLGVGTRHWDRVVRALGIRDRDGMTGSDVLEDTWRRHATATRALFDRHVGPVGTDAPWVRVGARQ